MSQSYIVIGTVDGRPDTVTTTNDPNEAQTRSYLMRRSEAFDRVDVLTRETWPAIREKLR